MRQERRGKCWTRSNGFFRALRGKPPRKQPSQGRLLERTQPMVHEVNTLVSRQRSERRISVRLPMQVSGRDARGVVFTEETSCENLCRSGAAFLTRFEVAIGSDLEIRIPQSVQVARRSEGEFSPRGGVGLVTQAGGSGGRLGGVQLRGRRFKRLFGSESAA